MYALAASTIVAILTLFLISKRRIGDHASRREFSDSEKIILNLLTITAGVGFVMAIVFGGITFLANFNLLTFLFGVAIFVFSIVALVFVSKSSH
ncbi:hypothetical protein [Brevundimonas diminuta]|uniref:hypothetical protein n=1 Tax=Brevundimonas diminuta TaxID=293 RepID=UPI003208B293